MMNFSKFWQKESFWPPEIAEKLLGDMFSPATPMAFLTITNVVVGVVIAWFQNNPGLYWLAALNFVCYILVALVIQFWRHQPKRFDSRNWTHVFACSTVPYAFSVGLFCAFGIATSSDSIDRIFLIIMMVYGGGLIARGGASFKYTILCMAVAGQPIAYVLFAAGDAVSVFLGVFVSIMILTSIETILYRRRMLVEIFLARYQSDQHSKIDPLTGLLNRRGLADSFNNLKSTERPVAVHYLDLDFFKEANDQHGHLAGDYILSRVATRVQQLIGATDVLHRIGGDEFLLLQAETTDQDTAIAFAERMIVEISRPYVYGNQTIIIGVSVGLVFATGESRDPERLIKCADDALYKAKRQRRGRVVLAA